MQWHLLKMKLEMFWAGLIQFKTQTANPLQSLLICQNFIEILIFRKRKNQKPLVKDLRIHL